MKFSQFHLGQFRIIIIYRCSNDDESCRMPLFEALDSLTWPRIQSGRGARTASSKSVSSTGAVIDIITSSSGSERDALTTNVELQNSGHNPEPTLTRTLSRSSAPKSMPQSPDLIRCADRSATKRKTYVPHLPQSHTTFKPIFTEQKKHHHHRHQKHRRQDVETPPLPPPISGFRSRRTGARFAYPYWRAHPYQDCHL